jgi:hypothetical protein
MKSKFVGLSLSRVILKNFGCFEGLSMKKTNARRFLDARTKKNRSLVRKWLKFAKYHPSIGTWQAIRFPDGSCLYWHFGKGDVEEASDLATAERLNIESLKDCK